MDWQEMEEKKRKVLKALIQCSKCPDFKEDCGDCPYLDVEDGCIGRLCHDAYTIITHQDMLLQQMTDPNTVMIDKTAKPVQGLRYCQANRLCYDDSHNDACPYHHKMEYDQGDCIGDMHADLLKMIDGGDA